MLKKNWILPLFSLGLVCLTFIIFKSVLSYILISAVFALIARPLYVRLKKIHLGKLSINPSIASLGSILTIYAFIFSLMMIFVPAVVQEAKIITEIDPIEAVSAVQEPVRKIESVLNTYTDQPISLQKYFTEKATSIINISAVSSWINALSAFTGNLFISFFAITFITFFFLKDSRKIFENIYAIIPFELRDETDDVLIQVKSKLTRYFIGICIEILLVFSLNAIGLYFIGIENCLIIALFAGVINVIPYIGPLIGIIFGLIIVITTNYTLDWSTEILPIIGYTSGVLIITQLLDNFIFQPFIYSNSVHAHPLEIFLVILIAGNIYGIIGMMVAIPTYSVLRVIVKEIRGNSKVLNDIYKSTE
jgi:predicted PurR-regulated permease PerM